MTPYVEMPFFLTLLAISLPAIALQLAGRSVRWYVPFATAVMLVSIFSTTVGALPAMLGVLAFMAWEAALVLAYAWVRRHTASVWMFAAAALASIAPLVLVKIASGAGALALIGFLGISYLTFRCVELLFEIRDGLIERPRLVEVLTFVFFFPTVASGPIDRFRRFTTDLHAVRTRGEYLELLGEAAPKFYRGVLYKFIIAGAIQQWWLTPLYRVHHSLLVDTSYAYAYGLHLFFDFAGYSAFAIGTSYVFGIRVGENFDKPFLARNIRDFWNRWHISLSTWFRDFVFMRVVMLNAKRRWLKGRQASASAGYLVSMGLMGLWHGLALHYIVYGLYHGVLLCGYEYFSAFNKRRGLLPDTRVTQAVSVFVTVQLVFFGFLIFSGRLF